MTPVAEMVETGLKPVCAKPVCADKLNAQEAEALDAKVKKHIECKLIAFDTAIAESNELEIDGVSLDGKAIKDVTQGSKIKVLNHQTKDAYEVDIDSIVRTPLKDLILALKTGELIRLHGVTRIVGYYSRIHNWNKSKIRELQDRHKGNYGVGTR